MTVNGSHIYIDKQSPSAYRALGAGRQATGLFEAPDGQRLAMGRACVRAEARDGTVLLEALNANGEALHMAATLEIDAVIDPAETRAWLARGLASAQVGLPGPRFIDTW